MPTYLYCLLPPASEAPPADLAGITGERVRRLATRDVAAWVGTIGDAPVDRSTETARRHDAVVRAALRMGVTPLPARGGQRFDDDARCLEEMAEHAPAIGAALERVSGCVEMSVRIVMPSDGIDPDTPVPAGPPVTRDAAPARGRAYLEALRARLAMEHKVQAGLAGARDLVVSPAGDLIRAEAASGGHADGELTLHHLVRRSDVARYRELVEGAGATHRVPVRVGGPWAPYSFSEIRG